MLNKTATPRTDKVIRENVGLGLGLDLPVALTVHAMALE